MLHRTEDILARQLSPRGSDDGRFRILLTNASQTILDFRLRRGIGMRKNDTGCIFKLVVEEFTKILHIHFAFAGIYNSGQRIENSVLEIGIGNCTNDIGKLTDT